MGRPRRHHYVPEFYLRGFVPHGSAGKIFVYDKEAGRCFGTSVKNVAVKRDYYRMEAAEDFGQDPLMLEKYLSQIESKAADLTKRLISREDLEGQDRIDWAEFLAAMYVRGPNARQMMAEVTVLLGMHMAEVATATEDRYNTITEKMKRDGYEPKTDVTYEEFKKFLTERNFEMEVDEQFTLRSFVILGKLAHLFYEMEWTVLKTSPKAFFVTSDSPVVYSSPPETHHPRYGDRGLLNKKVELLFPLNKRVMFVGTWEKLRSVSLPSAFYVEMLNRRIIGQAFRYIYAPIRSPEILEVAKQAKGAYRRLANPDLPKVTLKRSLRTD